MLTLLKTCPNDTWQELMSSQSQTELKYNYMYQDITEKKLASSISM